MISVTFYVDKSKREKAMMAFTPYRKKKLEYTVPIYRDYIWYKNETTKKNQKPQKHRLFVWGPSKKNNSEKRGSKYQKAKYHVPCGPLFRHESLLAKEKELKIRHDNEHKRYKGGGIV